MSDKLKRDRVTKELALAITPIAAAYLFIAFYEAGTSSFYGIPYSLIDINMTDVFVSNRLTLIVATLAFLWIALYYNVLPSANSPIFKGLITLILILSLWLGFTFGKQDARKRIQYLVTNTEPEYVALKFYGDHIILAPLIRNTKHFQKHFRFLNIGQNEDIIYKLENVGPLSVSY